MAINAGKLTQDNPAALDRFEWSGVPAINLTNVAIARFRPGYRGIIERVQANARTVNSAAVPEVRIVAAAADAGTNVLSASLTMTAVATASPAAGALVASKDSLKFGPTDEIIVHITTGGTAPVNPNIVVTVRPFPLSGEA
jgi:hypothetical protein